MSKLEGNTLTRDQALLILNDHVGQEIEVIVTVYRGDMSAMVMSADGTLAYWRSKDPAAWATYPREDIIGLYDIGQATIDITDLRDARLLADDGQLPYGLAVTLISSDDEMTATADMTVIWGPRTALSRSS